MEERRLCFGDVITLYCDEVFRIFL